MPRPALPFDQDLADQICERIATSDDGLEDVLDALRIERGEHLVTPGLTTIYKWLDENEAFAKQSARARELQSHLLFDRAQKQAREPLEGTVIRRFDGKDGVEITETTSDNVERSKLLVQTTLRRAGQLNPKKYGDKFQAELTGSVDVSLVDRLNKARQRVEQS